jgi:phosphatidylglycerol:prolipoprotein diacylglycerol transferase
MSSQIHIASIAVNSYTAYVVIAALLAAGWAAWRASSSPGGRSAVLNGLLIIGAMSLALGRVGYGLLNLSYFQEHPAELISTASPGYSEHAVILGGLLGWALTQRLRQRVPATSLVLLATFIGIGASIGCVPNGCAYGREVFWTDGLLWQLRMDWPDAYTINNPRIPVQLLEAAWLLLCLLFALAAARTSAGARDGTILLLWTVLFALGDFVLQFLRADPAGIVMGLRIPQWADFALCLITVAGLAIYNRKLVQSRRNIVM